MTFLRSETDLGVFTVLYMANLIGILLLFVSFKHKCQDYNKFLQFFEDTDIPDFNEEDCKIWTRKIHLIYIKKIIVVLGN